MSDPQSRNEAILQATIDGTEYTDPPQSRIEDLLLQLKEAIEEGGGGGGGEDVEKRLDDCEQNILAIAIGLAIETGAEASGTSDNIMVEVFDSTEGYVIENGIYDSINHRLYA